jgi:hypothetical protein
MQTAGDHEVERHNLLTKATLKTVRRCVLRWLV